MRKFKPGERVAQVVDNKEAGVVVTCGQVVQVKPPNSRTYQYYSPEHLYSLDTPQAPEERES